MCSIKYLFLLTLGEPGVRAWDVPEQPDLHCIDVKRYRVLFERAVQTILDPIQQSVAGGADNECLYVTLLIKWPRQEAYSGRILTHFDCVKQGV